MKVALLTNFVPPYLLPVYQELAHQCSGLKIFLSALTESGRTWEPDLARLPVSLQRNIALRGNWRHPNGFSERSTVHIPYDTIPQLVRFKPDVILSGELGMRSLQAYIYRRLAQHCKLVIWAKVSDVTELGRGRVRHLLRSKLLGTAEGVIVNGEAGSRYISTFGVEPSRMFRIPYTTNLAPFLAIPATRDDKTRVRLLYCGALSERKGLLPFLGVLSRWAVQHSERTLHFDLFGHGPLQSEIELFPRPANLRIEVMKSVPYAALPTAYQHRGILVFPTLADEWGMVVTEAMAAGMPVLGSLYSQAVEELVTNGRNGWTFRPDIPSEMEQALDQALSQSMSALNVMANYARAAVIAITPASVASRILAVTEQVALAPTKQ